uniref:Uncharacterized protein n=1 Tax=viral metagenome TaxID=1070528 RepID=A0A6C0I821_9ZZZZ
MATGISSPWGLSLAQIGGMQNVPEINGQYLMYQQGLSSVPVNNNVSPLTLANQGYYTRFGSTTLQVKPKEYIIVGNKKFKIGSKAKINQSGAVETITNIGPKQIILRKGPNAKEHRLSIRQFVLIN